MSRVDFWMSMHEGGDLVVDAIGEELADTALLEQAIRSIESHCRPELAFEPPRLVLPVAVWAATLMYRASQCLVYREIEATTVQKIFKQPCPMAPAADVCYSADLALRALQCIFAGHRSKRQAARAGPHIPSWRRDALDDRHAPRIEFFRARRARR